jgi:2-polyprenyl-3-methyl-5-hydroxy-6-metoxy-1,4-benzoquinol methylase
MGPEAANEGAATSTATGGRSWTACLVVAGVLLGFFVPIVHYGKAVGQDWKYFDSLTLVVRSIVLHYHRLPLHDPWVFGGMDIPGNPQSRVFSPAFLLDLALGPYYANFGYLVLYALLGAWGMHRLLRGLGVSSEVAAAAGLLYVNSTWFALHMGEGHLPFGPFYLLPWVLHLTWNAHRPACVLGLGSLLALFLLDGGMYPFIYSLILVLASVAVGLVDLRAVVRGARGYWGTYALGVLAAGLVASAKIVPVLAVYGHRLPVQESTVMPLSTLKEAFFSLHQTIYDQPAGSPHRFHEYGCYLGVVAAVVVGVRLLSPSGLRSSARYLVLMALWLWTATGWGGAYNPWTVLQHVPLINNAHVQSRFLLPFHLFFLVLLARAIDRLQSRLLVRGLLVFLVLEGLVATGYTWATTFERYPGPSYDKTLITSRVIRGTIFSASKPWHYFDGTLGARSTYEPAEVKTAVRITGEPGYRGEAYVTGGRGSLELRELSPGRVELATESAGPLSVEVNTNYLEGWKVLRGAGDVHPTADGLVAVDVPPGRQDVVLAYAPRYLPWILGAFVAGCGLWIYSWAVLLTRQNSARAERAAHSTGATFDYSRIPVGYYDEIYFSGSPVRRCWHICKFERVLDALPRGEGLSLLDIGCFCGTFLGIVGERRFSRQLGVDILPEQVAYAERKYGRPFRRFMHVKAPSDLRHLGEKFDCVTLIEVIEHLTEDQIRGVFETAADLLEPGGKLIFSTPNYASTWPLLELALNRVSDVSYEEQHVTKFTYWNVLRRLREIVPGFDSLFEADFRTTTHFLAPPLAVLSLDLAVRASRALPHKRWHVPFGNLVLVGLVRRRGA